MGPLLKKCTSMKTFFSKHGLIYDLFKKPFKGNSNLRVRISGSTAVLYSSVQQIILRKIIMIMLFVFD